MALAVFRRMRHRCRLRACTARVALVKAIAGGLLVGISIGPACALAQRPFASATDSNAAASPAAQRHLIRGVTQAMLGDPESAVAHLERALNRSPQHPALLQALADAHAARGELATALFYARRARTQGGHRPYYHRRLAELQRAADETPAALQTYRALVDRFPAYRPGYRALASLQDALGRPQAALNTYASLQDRGAPLSTAVHRRLLRLYRAVGERAGVERTLRTLRDRRPSVQTYRRQLAALYSDTGRSGKALDLLAPLARRHPADSALQKQVEQLVRRTDTASPSAGRATALSAAAPQSSSSVSALLGRARALSDSASGAARPDSARLRRATSLLRSVLDRAPGTIAAWSLLARVQRQRGEFAAAGQSLRTSLDKDPRDAGRWTRAAAAYAQVPRYETATAIAEEGLLLFPGHAPLARIAGRLHLHAGRPRNARAHFRTALRQVEASTQPERAAALRAGLGLAHTHLGETAAADSAFRAARSRAAPPPPVVLRRHAYSLALRGTELERALRLAQRAVAQSPESSLFLDTLGWIQFQRGDLPAARRRLQSALDEGRPSARVLEHYGTLQDALGNDETARTYWKQALEQAPDRTSVRQHLEASSAP